MHSARTRLIWLLPVCAALMLAADPGWKSKAVPNWTAADARQILTDSPWTMTATAGLTRRQNEDERRDGGNMGQPHGVGYDGVGAKQVRAKITAETVFHDPYRAPAPESLRLRIRWESALPVRMAELKAGEVEPPTLEGDGYKIAVYDIPGIWFEGDPKSLGDPLRNEAVLRREGKKDVKPLRVEVFQRQDGIAIVYLFPLSAEIGKKDSFVEFNAQIGRIVIRQSFDVQQMEFQGRLEL